MSNVECQMSNACAPQELASSVIRLSSLLPARFRNAWDQALQSKLAETNAAQRKAADIPAITTTLAAAIPHPIRVLAATFFVDQ
jgi:hypothetical protein